MMSRLRLLVPMLLVLGSLATNASANGNSDPVMANGYTVQIEIATCTSHGPYQHCHLWWHTVFTTTNGNSAAQVAELFELAIEFGFVADILPDDITFNHQNVALQVRIIHIDLTRNLTPYQPRLPVRP